MSIFALSIPSRSFCNDGPIVQCAGMIPAMTCGP
jgi:hypothetical protein